MKRPNCLSAKQIALSCGILLLFSTIILYLFQYQSDEVLFHNLCNELFQEEMKNSTLSLHYTLAHPENFGITQYDVALPCYNPKNLACTRKKTKQVLSSLQQISPTSLTEQDAYNYMLLTRFLENTLAMSYFPYFEEPFAPNSGMHTQLPILFTEYTFRNKKDVEDYLILLEKTEDYFSSLLLLEQEKKEAGFFMPSSSLQQVVTQCKTIMDQNELTQGTHFLQTSFQERLENLMADTTLPPKDQITSEEYCIYLEKNNHILTSILQPTYVRLAQELTLLEDPTIPLSGLASKPNGRDYYLLLLRSETGSYRDLSEIRSLLSESLIQEYKAIRALISEHETSLSTNNVPVNPSFPITTAGNMISDLQTRMEGIFPPFPCPGSLQNAPTVTIKPVATNLQSYCAPAFYLTTPIDESSKNVIYINQKNSPSGAELYTTLAHEGYPGHLYQTVYNNRYSMLENRNLIREILWYGGYLEGWAIYTEFLSYNFASKLMLENHQTEGAYHLQLEKHNRSLQLCIYSLLDIMIHYDNASFKQIAETLAQFGITDEEIIRKIYTYIVEEPCNYLKYYLGYLEVLALQEQAKEIWKDDYSDYNFHRFYLECGPSDFFTLSESLESSYE